MVTICLMRFLCTSFKHKIWLTKRCAARSRMNAYKSKQQINLNLDARRDRTSVVCWIPNAHFLWQRLAFALRRLPDFISIPFTHVCSICDDDDEDAARALTLCFLICDICTCVAGVARWSMACSSTVFRTNVNQNVSVQRCNALAL